MRASADIKIAADVPVWSLLPGAEYHTADLGQELSPQGQTDQMTANYILMNATFYFSSLWSWNSYGGLGIGRGTNTRILKDRTGGPTMSTAVDPTFDEILNSHGLRSE